MIGVKLMVSEGKHALRVNGVTLAKRHLRELFPTYDWNENGNVELPEKEGFFRMLLLVPFLAKTKDPKDAPTAAGRYFLAKTKRLTKSLNLEAGTVAPFMFAMGELGKLDVEHWYEVYRDIHDHVCACGGFEKEGSGLINKKPKSREGKTVH